MKITRRQADGATIMALQGRLTAGAGAGDAALHAAVRGALEAGARNLLIGLAGVSAIDSCGIGELGSAYTSVTRRGGRLGLFGVSPTVLGVLRLTRLVELFEIFDDEAAALRDEPQDRSRDAAARR